MSQLVSVCQVDESEDKEVGTIVFGATRTPTSSATLITRLTTTSRSTRGYVDIPLGRLSVVKLADCN